MVVGMGMTGFLRVKWSSLFTNVRQQRPSEDYVPIQRERQGKQFTNPASRCREAIFCNILGVNPSLIRTSFSFFYILEFHLNLLYEKY